MSCSSGASAPVLFVTPASSILRLCIWVLWLEASPKQHVTLLEALLSLAFLCRSAKIGQEPSVTSTQSRTFDRPLAFQFSHYVFLSNLGNRCLTDKVENVLETWMFACSHPFEGDHLHRGERRPCFT